MEAKSTDASSDQDEEDVFDGLDLSGVPEQEKDQIKQAILASKQDQYNQQRSLEQQVKNRLQEGQSKSKFKHGAADRTEGGDDNSTKKEPATVASGGRRGSKGSEAESEPEIVDKPQSIDDDETQPPSDQADEEDGDDVLEFSKSTQVMADNVSAYQYNTDVDGESDKSQPTKDADTSPHPHSTREVPSSPAAMDTDQGSEGFSPRPEETNSAGSQGSVGSGGFQVSGEKGAKGEGQRPEGAVTHSDRDRTTLDRERPSEQLHRHYRAVKKKTTSCSRYFQAEEQSAEQCAKAIFQLFETYRIKLREAQRKLYPKLEWGNSVKSGQHQAKSIDVKKRGHASVYLELSDEDEEEDFKVEGKKSWRKVARGMSNSDDEFEIKRSAKGRGSIEEEIMSVETQEYDLSESTGNVGIKTVQGEPVPKSRLRKRKSKVLVEDTQEPDVSEKDFGGDTHLEYIVEETQAEEDDLVDYLSVKKDHETPKQKFENPMQQAKLKGYAIPVRRTDKVESERKGEQSNWGKEKEETVQHLASETYISKDTETKTTTARGRKRKCKKDPVTLVEDTQDIATEFSVKENAKAGVRRKRQCFRLSSDSDEESIPETQGMDDSPEVIIIEEKSSPVATKEAGKPKHVIPKMFEKVKKVITKEEAEQIEDPDSENESQSPIIKRSSRLRNKPVQKNKLDENKDQSEEAASEALQAGVKRLFSRPESKESYASDDVSVASSQISNTMIDECGDLYSTQIAGAGRSTRHHKRDVNQNVKSKAENTDLGNKIEDILNIDSDDDELAVKEVKKTFGRKRPNIGHATRIGIKQTIQNEPSISQYFTGGRDNISHTKDMDQINLNPEANDSKHLIDVNLDHIENDLEEDPVAGISFRINEKDHPVKKGDGARVPLVAVVDITNENAEHDPKANYLDEINQEKVKLRSRKVKCRQDLFDRNDEPPISLNDFSKEEMNRSVASDRHTGGARPKTKRQRKPETVTVVDEEEEEESAAKTARTEEPGVQCPLCSVHFPRHVIEQHAAICVGTVPVEVDEEVENRPRVNKNQGTRMPREADSDEIPLMGDDSPVHIHDTSVHDVMKGFKSSAKDDGEREHCFICDENVLKGRAFEQHLNQCVQRARQQQEEVDTKGFQRAFNPEPDEEPEIRQTRGRVRGTNRDSPVAFVPAKGVRGGNARARTPTMRREQRDDGYTSEPQVTTKRSSESDSESDTSSWEGSSSSSSDGDDDNITLGALARAGSSSLVTGPWNSRPGHSGTQSDGSNPVPDWLKRTADSPIKSFVPVSMQENSEYFSKQFSYNEKRVLDKQRKRKRKSGKPKQRRKRRKVRRKKQTN